MSVAAVSELGIEGFLLRCGLHPPFLLILSLITIYRRGLPRLSLGKRALPASRALLFLLGSVLDVHHCGLPPTLLLFMMPALVEQMS